MNHDHYFKRNTVYKVEEDIISIVDVHENNNVTPLDPWMGMIVLLADGQHTISQLIKHMAGQYPNGIPENLIETIESAIKRLDETKVIELIPEPVTLPYYLNMPMDDQDPKMATEMMTNDGFLRPPQE